MSYATDRGCGQWITLDVYGHAFDEFDPVERLPAEDRISALAMCPFVSTWRE